MVALPVPGAAAVAGDGGPVVRSGPARRRL